MKAGRDSTPSICFVGLNNLSALAPEFRNHEMGGAQLQQTLLAKALVREGFQVSMVVADLGQADGAEWHGIRTYKAYRLDAGIPGARFIHPRWTGVWSALRRANANVNYCSCADVLLGQVALFNQRHAGNAAFRIAHDFDCQPDKLLIPNWRGKVLYRYGLRRADLILAQTATQQAQMKRNFGRNSRVIPSLLEFGADNLDFAARDIDLLWVSNIRPFKRPDLVLDMGAQIPDLKVRMIGGTQPGFDEYFADIRRRALDLPNVAFCGSQPYEAVNQQMARARLFINTSDSEGFPNTYLQAWARGTPVVAFFDPDGVIAREGLGRVVQSVEQMRSAIRQFLTEPELWSTTSARCVHYVSAQHGESAVNAYVDALLPLATRVQ